MDQEVLNTKVKFIRGFADKTRIQILAAIKEEEKTVSQIMQEVDASQSSISQHLGCLRECGLIVGRQEGKYSYYSLSSERVKLLLDMMDDVFLEVQTGVACCEQHFEAEEGGANVGSKTSIQETAGCHTKREPGVSARQ